MRIPREPAKDRNPSNVWLPFWQRILTLFARLRARGFHPMLDEGYRSVSRQEWLFGYGRKYAIGKKPKTWTMESKHCKLSVDGTRPAAKAVDVCDSKTFYSDPAFFDALTQEVEKISGIDQLHDKEGRLIEVCHVQWNG